MNASRRAATALVLGGIVSVQVGAAFATSLFDELGPGGTVFVRIAFAAVLLMVISRPLRCRGAGILNRDVVLLGLVLAGMNLSFYQAIDRIPLGIAVTLEFIGPLGVAIAGSRRRLDLLWVTLAAAGILLLSPVPGSNLDGLGVVLALVTGLFWGAYILVTARVGRAIPGGGGLAIAMTIGAIAMIPIGVADGGFALLNGELLAIGFAVAVLSSAIPYSLELEALRRLPESTFGLLMSLEPAVAATVGFAVLNQDLALREVLAIGLVLVASMGALGGVSTTPRVAEA